MSESKAAFSHIPFHEVKPVAREVASAMRGASGSARDLPKDLRQRFIAVRSALFQRGIYDPVLVRFDSATAPPATPAEVAEQLEKVAESL